MLLDFLVAILTTMALMLMAMPYLLVRYERTHQEAATPLLQEARSSR